MCNRKAAKIRNRRIIKVNLSLNTESQQNVSQNAKSKAIYDNTKDSTSLAH